MYIVRRMRTSHMALIGRPCGRTEKSDRNSHSSRNESMMNAEDPIVIASDTSESYDSNSDIER